jgi:hypothetical protein
MDLTIDLDNIYYKAKSMLRPVTRHRRVLERIKFLGAQILSSQAGNDFLAQSIQHPPAAVGKMGSSELAALRYYLRCTGGHGICDGWGWRAKVLYRNAGVYPPTPEVFSRFCEVYAKALAQLDVLGIWFNFGERDAWRRFAPNARLTLLSGLAPFFHERPWTQQLARKRVLVVSPFAETIKAQYLLREAIWAKKPEILPAFELLTLQCPLSAFLVTPKFPDWFAALDAMQEQMTAMAPFDVAIVGAGAWSIPLVAHAKSVGAWAIHLGGGVQLLFGITGRRWDAVAEGTALRTEAWTRPSANETPEGVDKVEGGCYW